MAIRKDGKKGKPLGPSTAFSIVDEGSETSSKIRPTMKGLSKIRKLVQLQVSKQAQGSIAYDEAFPDRDDTTLGRYLSRVFLDVLDAMIARAHRINGERQDLKDLREAYLNGDPNIKSEHDKMVCLLSLLLDITISSSRCSRVVQIDQKYDLKYPYSCKAFCMWSCHR